MGVNGFLNGFNSGYRTVDHTMQAKKRNEQYDARVAKNDERYKERVEREDARYQAGVTRQNRQDEISEQKFSDYQEDRKAGISDKAYNDARVKKQHGRDDKAYALEQRKGRYNNVMQGIANAYSADKTGANIPQEQWLKWQEESKGTNAEILFDVNKQEASKFLVEQMKNGFANADDSSIKQATNTYLNGQINRHLQEGVEDNQGQPITNMEFSRWEPDGKGGLIAHVNVQNQTGETYEAPITKFRSADDDDPIRVYNAEKLFEHMIAENQLVNVLSQNGYLEKLNGPNRSGVNSTNVPAAIQENKYFANVTGRTEGEAAEITMTRSGDQSRNRMAALKMAKESFKDEDGFVMSIDANGQLVPAGTENARLPNDADYQAKANSFMDYVNGAGPTHRPAPKHGEGQLIQAISFGKKAIEQGKDPAPIRQRLLELGLTEEQLKQEGL